MIEAAVAAMAYVGGRLLTGRDSLSVVDRVSGVRSGFSGAVDADRVNVLDQQLGCLVTGRADDAGKLWLFHQETMRYLTLQPERPGCLAGHDHSTHHAFDVLVQDGGSVEVLDYQGGLWRRFQLEAPRVLVD
ncbi:hypothetical protein GB931_14310 [Modestobacter sp. I12A-02628]|uniref:Uncharacterized protein n=1 Tax=Goekera deserti TaxID=2497753 RepID=A0A7K3WHH7_9ACTN|nr:hypothetical protein [Goekera deserti]MPQ99074.1 hypothetical protein [Goekera deserti]NDI47408.1 hypothetical protein [Goekera deserti]NEL55938.1 hypothetical protein [Goekera deserti]